MVKRIDCAPVLSEYIDCNLVEKPNEMFFFNKDYVTEYQNATTEDKKNSVLGFGYMQKILMFFKHHYRVGELFMEYVKHSCNEEKKSLCEFCATHNWIGPPAKRIPQPKPDEDNPGHYLPVFKTPLVDNEGQIREADDWQPRVHITSLFKEGKISLNDKDAIKETASRLGIDEKLAVSCLEHLRDLSVNK